MNDPCKNDDDCNVTTGYKCCADPCGITCRKPVFPRAGFCPAVTIIPEDPNNVASICITDCEQDSDCEDPLKKCCTAPCGSLICTTFEDIKSVECVVVDCDFVLVGATIINLIPRLCADGTIERWECRRVDGYCRNVWRKCPDIIPDIIHPGYCPASFIKTTLNANCTSPCGRDNDCAPDHKCCFSTSQCEKLQCLPAVNRRCLAAGYRNNRCVDESIALTLSDAAPTDGSILPDKCYRCIELVNCAAHEDFCGWNPSDVYKRCISQCTQPDIPVENTCISRNPCECLKSDNCSLCQFTRIFYDAEKNAFKVPFTACIPRAISNKCIADSTADGFSGSLILTRPAECENPDVPKVFDPSLLTNNEVVKRIVQEITDGRFSAYDYQKVLEVLGIKDIIIEIVGESVCDEVRGKITIVITIVSGNRTLDEIKVDLTRAIKHFFEIPDNMVIKTTLEKDTSSKKRATTSSYLQSSTIEPAPTSPTPSPSPSSSPSPSPSITPDPASASTLSGFMTIWLIGLISLLFLKR
jgi:hypothetical protein